VPGDSPRRGIVEISFLTVGFSGPALPQKNKSWLFFAKSPIFLQDFRRQFALFSYRSLHLGTNSSFQPIEMRRFGAEYPLINLAMLASGNNSWSCGCAANSE
jgi:hypothetical protein